jgi:hypothetical protein
MLLQSHRSFDTMARYDPATGQVEIFSRSARPDRATGPLSGVFGEIGRGRMLLYRTAGVLCLEVGGLRLPMAGLDIQVRVEQGHRLLRIVSEGRVIVALPYEPPHLDPPLSADPTPFIEDEDFDFGLFLQNVSRDPSRQARMYLERDS